MIRLAARDLALAPGGRVLVEGLDLTIEAGQCWGVLGPNGAGKSTLLRVLAGLEAPLSGSLMLDDRPLADWSGRERARRLGVLFQAPEPLFPGTLLEAALAGRHPHLGRLGWESGTDLALARAALAAVDLEERLHADPATLSGGERQRLELATLLAQDPALALLDEPTNHLDPAWQLRLLDLVAARFVGPERACLMVLHDLNLALRYCTHLLLLRGDGRWRAAPRAELATAETFEWLYEVPVTQVTTGGRVWFLFGEVR